MDPSTDKTIAAAWERYRTQVMPPQAGAVQVTESKAAFYAGAAWLLISSGVIGVFCDESGAPVVSRAADELRAACLELAAEKHARPRRLLENVRMLRLGNGFTQYRCATWLNVTRAEYGRLERGELELTALQLEQLAELFDVTPGELWSL